MGRPRRPPPPSATAIVEANRALLNSLPPFWLNGSSVPRSLPGEEDETCWACGVWIEATPEKAHVLAVSHGGGNEPENYYLLCSRCHDEQPDGAPRRAQDAWLASREHHSVRKDRECAIVMAALRWLEGQTGKSLASVGFASVKHPADIDKTEKWLNMAGAQAKAAGIANEVPNSEWTFVVAAQLALEEGARS